MFIVILQREKPGATYAGVYKTNFLQRAEAALGRISVYSCLIFQTIATDQVPHICSVSLFTGNDVKHSV